ncbi:MAG: hypothetical protein M1814_001444 [Vezdaea aestivalis]|nr:MAG: hypothetical protein M1814_001444 [Vezdaea aestivalis]
MSESTVNLPQLLALVVFGGFVLRWIFYSSGSSTTGSGGSQVRGRGQRVDERHVEQILQMFPQLSRREIYWDLMRNGGSIAATSERVLSGRGLDNPPPSFQPPAAPGSSTPARASTAQPARKAPQYQDLITRYNLHSKVDLPEAEASMPENSGKGNWSSNKNDRQLSMQQRREEMVLRARRKMLEKTSATST